MNNRADALRNEGADVPGAVFPAAAMLLGAALLLGGGSGFPLADMAVQLAGIVTLAIALVAGRGRMRRPGAGVPLLLIGLAAATIAVQLVPLPPEMWKALPGREVAWRTAQAAGMADGWRPISMDGEASVRAALSLLPAVGMFAATLLLPARARGLLLTVVLAATATHLVAAAMQVGSGGTRFYPHPDGHRGVAAGLFENRNHFATLLAVASVAAAALLRRREDRAEGVGWASGGWAGAPFALAAALFAIGAAAVASGSRMGAGLFALALLSAPFVSGWARPRNGRHFVGLTAAGLVVAAAGFATLTRSSLAGRLADRIERTWREGDVDRVGIWEDARYGARDLFPAGSGLGTFQPVFDIYERLSEVGTHRANHAHNDYLELVFETGVGGAAVVLAFAGWWAARSWLAWRDPRRDLDATLARAAAVAVLLVLVHSAVDYPLRTAGIATLFGLLCALLVRDEEAPERGAGDRRERVGLTISTADAGLYRTDGNPRP